MKRKNVIIGIGVFVLSIVFIVIVGGSGNNTSTKTSKNSIYTTVQKGKFEIAILTTGELQAENYSVISAPSALQSRSLRISNIQITDLVPEGTEVKKGDYVATLNQTDLSNTLKTELETLTTYQTNLEMKILDTAVTLSNARDNIKNLRFNLEQAKITLDQSKYEPPATIRKAEMDVDRAERSIEQSQNDYSLKVRQTNSEMATLKSNLSKQQQKVNELQSVLDQFIINAPADGMVIYKKEQDGSKRKIGSNISSYDLVVATLPDLTTLVSKTYVNEIDISKIRIGQKVKLSVDAFAGKEYEGEVISLSNVGEQLPSASAKVFEVNILISGNNPLLRPSMTSGNRIIVKTYNDVIYIPLSSIEVSGDKTFVYLKDKTKQEIIIGETDQSDVIVKQGLEPGTVIYVNSPSLLANN